MYNELLCHTSNFNGDKLLNCVETTELPNLTIWDAICFSLVPQGFTLLVLCSMPVGFNGKITLNIHLVH